MSSGSAPAQALFHPAAPLTRPRARARPSLLSLPFKKRHRQALLRNRFLYNSSNYNLTAAAIATRLSSREMGRAAATTRAVLAIDPASEISRKFNIDHHSELQLTVAAPPSPYPSQIEIKITNSSSSLFLHWGAIAERRKEWIIPANYPNGTRKYKDKALRTPFVRSDSNSILKLELEYGIQGIEFLIFDEALHKWYKDNGHNFQILLPKKDKLDPIAPVLRSQDITPPEDLVQIQAYLRWERNGRQNYTQAQEKEEYVAAQFELEEEISRGISVDELRTKLTKSNNSAKEIPKFEKNRHSNNGAISQCVPDDLVQVQAYKRWEKAGKPNYSQEKQKMEFEETRKKLQLELDNGLSVDELRRKLLEGNIQIKVSKQMENKNYVAKKKICRKKWDVMKLLNKYSPDIFDETSVLPTNAASSLDLFSDAKIEHDGGLVLNKKMFKLESRELLVLVTSSYGKTKVCLATDHSGPLVLHWGLSRKSREWMLPPSDVAPPNSVLLGKACETPFSKHSLEESFDFDQVQTVELEINGSDFDGLPFVIHTDGHWMKNNGSDFYVEINAEEMKMKKEIGDGKCTAKSLLHRIAELESEAERSFMHRFNIASDLMEKVRDEGKLGFIGMLVWMRFMATRQLVWNKNYNVKPREISKAQDRLTDLLQNAYERYPQHREIIRMILSTVGRGGEGDVGQRIRDEILVIQRNNDCKGGMMEEWHQKLHNNTSPDDVVICQALIDYINSGFDINVYWNTLMSNGITKERLLSYDRAIHSEPNFRSNQKEGLLRDLGHYTRTLKAVHSGADLESAIATCLGYSAKGEGFMVGVQINPVRGLPSGFPELLRFIVDHVEDKDVETLVEALLEAREELRPLLENPHECLKDLLFLDIALDSTVRTAIERGYEKLHNASPERIMYFVTLVLENLAISSDDNEDLIYCLKGWCYALEMIQHKDDQWALFAKSFLDRTRLALSSMAEHSQQILQPSTEYLGSLLGVDQWAISIFTEEMIRAGSAAALSALLNRLDPTLRRVANLGSWQVISPNEASGYIVIVDELLSVQNKSYKKPTILVAKSVKGEEEIPDGTVAVLTPDMPDVLSHVSVRARNCKVCFATCFDTNILNDLQQNEGKLFSLKPTSSDIVYSAIKESELSNGNSENLKEDQSLPPITLDTKQFRGKYAISSHEFTPDMVGAKSRNIAYLQGKVPSWIGVPTSVALPFGVFEKVLSNDLNKEIAAKLRTLKTNLYEEEFWALAEIREKVLQLKAPSQLVEELKLKMQESGMPWPGGEGDSRWEQAWLAIKKVWSSKWNERAYFSTRKTKLDHEYLCMAVLVQEIISADYAFVVHTINPSSGDSSEIYAEVVRGLGETLVGAYPGRALSFVCKKNDLNSPKVLGYPSKPIGLFIRPSIIFRSDSNGEDLEGYAGAGLYDSVPMDKEDEVILDYTSDPMIVDAYFRNSILSSIARTGSVIEELYGSPQDIEGVVKNGKITVVQTRPQM